MQQRLTLIVAGVLALLLGIGGYFGWRQIETLEGRLGEVSSQVVELGEQLDVAEERAREAETRAEQAEQQARETADQARQAQERATEAAAQAASAEEVATTEKERARQARLEAEKAAAERQRAEEAREEAERQRQDAITDAKLAQFEARDAKQEAERLREQRERDLDRLQRALEKMADTRRTALGLVMNLGDSIEFDFDRAEVRPENRELLSRIAGVLITAEDYQIQVFGHTDDVGTIEYNQELSERRAGAVRDYLVEAGIDPEIISVKGYGKSQPLVEGSDAEARQRNRRVEIAVVQTTGEMPPNAVISPPPDGGS